MLGPTVGSHCCVLTIVHLLPPVRPQQLQASIHGILFSFGLSGACQEQYFPVNLFKKAFETLVHAWCVCKRQCVHVCDYCL